MSMSDATPAAPVQTASDANSSAAVAGQTIMVGGVPVPAATATEQQIHDYVMSNFPTYAPWWDIADVRNMLMYAVRAGWDSNMLLAHLETTDWWKSTSDTARQWIALGFSDPATVAQRRTQAIYDIASITNAAGFNLDLADMSSLAEMKLRYGWDDITLRRMALGMFQAKGGQINFASDIGSTVQSIKAQAAQYLFRISDATAQDLAQKFFTGDITQQGITAYVQGGGKMAHPEFADDIDRGITPMQMMQPALQSVASTLEMSPDQIDLLAPKWSNILDYTDPKTNTVRPMTSAEAANWARTQTEYRYTKGANDQAATVAQGLAESMGQAKF